MAEPIASRPYMPGYGLLHAAQGAGLLPWRWAVARLELSRAFVTELNRKYKTDSSIDFFNPTDNACFRVRPTWAFGLTEADFTGTPTRWTFAP